MNPSTSDLVIAIDSAPGRDVVLLPNNSNVVLAAEQAGRLASKPTEIVPTKSLQAGLAAMVAFDPGRSAGDNANEMRDVLDGVATGEITIASRDARLNGVAVREGEFLGLVGDEPVASGSDFDNVANAVVDRLLAEPRGVMTLLTGEDEPDVDTLLARVRDGHPDLEVDVQRGGQPHYPLLLSAE
jgi:hypothetical protein